MVENTKPKIDEDVMEEDEYAELYPEDIAEEDRPDSLDEAPTTVPPSLRFEGGKYTADTQPRDAAGRFRTVLARLKVDLGTAGSDRALDKIEEIENLDYAGDYAKAAEAAGDLVSIIDRLDTGALNPESITNVREGSRELGKVIANLPFAFGEQAQKIRFSDLPPALRDLIEDMIIKVEAKIGKEDADIATQELRTFMSGGDYFSQSDISSQMAKMLRLLT